MWDIEVDLSIYALWDGVEQRERFDSALSEMSLQTLLEEAIRYIYSDEDARVLVRLHNGMYTSVCVFTPGKFGRSEHDPQTEDEIRGLIDKVRTGGVWLVEREVLA